MKLRTVATTVTGWLLVITGVGHTALVAIGTAATPRAEDRAIQDAMAASSMPVGGLERSYWDLYLGFSLMMALLLVGLGALVLLALHRAPELVHGSRGALVLLGLVLVPALAISALLLPTPPIVLLGLAVVAVTVALAQRPAPTRVQTGVPADIFER